MTNNFTPKKSGTAARPQLSPEEYAAKKKAEKDLEELTPLLQLAVEEAEKYKDADHRCEELGIRIREKEEKLKKYQELEKLKK